MITIDNAGIRSSGYADILAKLTAGFQAIYGSDAYLAPDSQDGQFLALIALAINDVEQVAVDVYNAFSPGTAQGAGLASLIKLNGLRKQAATYSTAPGTVTGTAGTIIQTGQVRDRAGNLWALPASIEIPASGTIDVLVTCTVLGAINAGTGAISQIATPTRGWNTFMNTADAIPGAPVETDFELRARQRNSTTVASQSIVSSIAAAVGNVPGVAVQRVYENPTALPDADNIPAHSIAVVVQGGDPQAVVDAVGVRAPPGIQTFGKMSGTYTDSRGLGTTIHYTPLTSQSVYLRLTLLRKPGFASSTTGLIAAALAAWINSQGVGGDIEFEKLYDAANLSGSASTSSSGLSQAQLDVIGRTYKVKLMQVGLSPNPTNSADVYINFDQEAILDPANVNIVVL